MAEVADTIFLESYKKFRFRDDLVPVSPASGSVPEIPDEGVVVAGLVNNVTEGLFACLTRPAVEGMLSEFCDADMLWLDLHWYILPAKFVQDIPRLACVSH